ncbi:MAG: hypothetical protein K2L51_04215, partial [Clostridiales bacterium]|nr:hypothetical protein [Clostridiales bacterium]
IAATSKLSLGNYATSLDEAVKNGTVTGSRAGFTSAVKKEGWESANYMYYQNTMILKFTQTDDKEGAYNLRLDKTIVSDAENVEYNLFESTVTAQTSDGKYKLYALDGVLLAAKDTKDELDALHTEINADGYARLAEEEKETLPAIGSVYAAEDADTIAECYELTQQDAFATEWKVRMVEGASTYTLCFTNGEKETELALPENTTEESTFYADGKILYADIKETASDAQEGFNYVAGEANALQKYAHTYYSFDIARGKTEKLNLGYIIPEEITPLYNATAKKYDAFFVKAYTMQNGVAYENDRSGYRTFITDTSGKVGIDLTPYNIQYKNQIIQLKEDRVLLKNNYDGYLVNDKGELITHLNTKLQVGNNLLAIEDGQKNYGAVDFDGKLALPCRYADLQLHGSAALATVKAVDGTTKIRQSITPSNVSGKDIFDEGEYIANPQTINGLVCSTQTVGEGSDAYEKVRIRNYAGTELATITGNRSIYINVVAQCPTHVLVRIDYTPQGGTQTTEYYTVK